MPIYAKMEHLDSVHIAKTVLLLVFLISARDATTHTFVQATDLRVTLEASFSAVVSLFSTCYHSTPTTHLVSIFAICVTTSARSSSPAWTMATALVAPPPFLVPSHLLSALQPVFF